MVFHTDFVVFLCGNHIVEAGSLVSEILDGITLWYNCFDCFVGTFKFKQN